MAKKAAPSAAGPKAAPATGSSTKPATKGEVYTKLATKTGLSKKQVSTVFESLTPRDVSISEAPSHGLSILDYAPRARGARAYTELVMEVIDRE